MKYKKLRCYYRFSDKARMGKGYSAKTCFLNFIEKFVPKNYEMTVIIDNCEKENIIFVEDLCKKYEYNYLITNDGNSIGFLNTCKLALNNSEDTINYFIEADYIHRQNSRFALFDIFNNFAQDDYVSLYDHPDKYYPYFYNTNINMILRGYCEIEEYKNFKSEIYYLKSGWWRTTPTTCCTFACGTTNLKNNIHHIENCLNHDKPNDWILWKNLLSENKKLFTPIPSYSGHTVLMPTGIDWKNL
jgi:hypothetical protein